jgi:type VI secretion system protein VasJ
VPTSDKTAVASIRTAIKYFFEDNTEDKKLKVPSDAFVYSISRNLVWGKLKLPPSKENITQIDPPNSVIQTKIGEWYSGNDWDVLIPRIELNFLNPDSGFQFWLDVQKYLVKALEQKGGVFIKAAEEVKISLALLLQNFPQLVDLKFKNKETAFADKDTINWINTEVTAMLGGSSAEKEPMLLPPIMGEDYDPINEEYEMACKELPKNFEENVAKMQSQISGDTRRKGRFLRQLNLANLCVEAKQYQLAKVHLLQLNEKIEEYNLAEWEPGLCVSVWQSTYLVNQNLLETKDKENKSLLESEQAKLFAKIANYDGVLAIKLSNKN